MNNPPVVVVDSDAIIAQINPNDSNHQQAREITEKLISLNAKLIYPATTVAESVTFIQRPFSSSASAYGTAVLFADPLTDIGAVDQNTISQALKYYGPNISKQDTFFDCIVLAVAEENNADAIFSFDKFYQKKGFKLASELI